MGRYFYYKCFVRHKMNDLFIPVPNQRATATPCHEPLDKLAAEWMKIRRTIFGLGGCCDYHPEDIALLNQALDPRS